MQCQSEFDLFCQVLAEDSAWLDSYQSSLLQGDSMSKKADSKKIVPLEEDELCESTDAPCEVASTRNENSFPDLSILEDLPALEFIHLNHSNVASQTYKLMKRAAISHFGCRNTICFKKLSASKRI